MKLRTADVSEMLFLLVNCQGNASVRFSVRSAYLGDHAAYAQEHGTNGHKLDQAVEAYNRLFLTNEFHEARKARKNRKDCENHEIRHQPVRLLTKRVLMT